MNRYTVIPKNPECGWPPVVVADGYEWWKERVVFWKLPQGITQLTGEPTKRISRLASDTDAPVAVAEFAADWVAGVVLETETAKVG